jgi:primosomal protein N' (replication factor Y)
MSRIAAVIVDISLDREFDYLIPEELASEIKIGSRVVVPFGHRQIQGYVIGFPARQRHPSLKPIDSIVGGKAYLDETMLRLARWMGEYYCAPFEAAVRTELPGAVRRKGAKFKERNAVELLKYDAAKAGKMPPKQQAVIDYLIEHGNSFVEDLITELEITQSPVKSLEKKKIVKISQQQSSRHPLSKHNILPSSALDLMPEQTVALKQVIDAVDVEKKGDDERSRVILLHGVTGSGKTEVYLQAISHVLQKGQGAIVLVPEISLTPQTVERFVSRFGDQIAVLHSHLSDGERHDEWHRIQDGKAKVVVGARSAVFAPVVNLGLIVVDEEHEPSYKQEEAPRYNARDVAVVRGQMSDCVVLLGSATPAFESWNNIQNGKYELATLAHRVDHRSMPMMRIVDMRMEMKKTGKPVVFSRILIDAIQDRINKAEQVILFLNRRGYSTSLICQKCGYVASCDECSVSYTYHRSDERIRCHICGADKGIPKSCPECNDPEFRYSGMGTQRVEKIMRQMFPKANIQRMDADVTTKKDSYERILGDFRVGKTDILIGTQMIAKGLHFPNVTLVGVVYADLSLHVPDFRAGERTFQLLAQVAGRAGRGDVPGEVLVQTYTPFHAAIQAARRLDYEGLCDQELEFRKELSYPPFSHLVCITLRGKIEEKVSFVAETLCKRIGEKVSDNVILSEATPAPLAKAKGQYRYQIIMRAERTRVMTYPLKNVIASFRFPAGVRYSIDVDALNLL